MRRMIAALALLTAVSCGDDIGKRYKDAAAKQPAAIPPAPVAASTLPSGKVGAADLRSWDIKSDDSVYVKYIVDSVTHELHGIRKNEDKREYTVDSDDSLLFTAKSAEDSIKILAPDGKMRWKVKLDGDKIRISDNDQNANAYLLSTANYMTRITAPDGHLIGTVKYEGGKNVMRDGFDKVIERMPAKFFRPAYGVVLIDGIDPAERFAMLCEIIDKTPAPTAPDAASPADAAKAGAADLQSWNIDKDGVVLVKYELIYSDNHQLHGVPKNDDKREYTLDSDQSLILTAKSAEDSIKILAPDGKLRWKVKIDGDQIKISDNDQNANAFVLTTLNSVTRVTAPDRHLIGTVKFENGKNVMRDGSDKVVDRMPSQSLRPAYGLILIDGISPPERFAMLCEVIDKTRRK